MDRAFVILEHSTAGETHFDWMFEEGGSLATWRVECSVDRMRVGDAVVAHRLVDHRRDYLTYEGEISGRRGRVRRVAEGTYAGGQVEAGTWRVTLSGGQRFALTQSPESWTITRLA